jgi:hypothetical protein
MKYRFGTGSRRAGGKVEQDGYHLQAPPARFAESKERTIGCLAGDMVHRFQGRAGLIHIKLTETITKIVKHQDQK